MLSSCVAIAWSRQRGIAREPCQLDELVALPGRKLKGPRANGSPPPAIRGDRARMHDGGLSTIGSRQRLYQQRRGPVQRHADGQTIDSLHREDPSQPTAVEFPQTTPMCGGIQVAPKGPDDLGSGQWGPIVEPYTRP